jgi:hypothetical protein
MKTITKILITVIFIKFSLILVGQQTFEKIYRVQGGESVSTGYFTNFISQDIDGEYVFGGSKGVSVESSNTFIAKANISGNIIWSKEIMIEGAREIIQTTDDGFLITTTSSGFMFAQSAMLIKTNSILDTIWTTKIGSESIMDNTDCIASSSIEVDNNYYLTIGSTDSYGVGNMDIYLIKTDINGNNIWTKTFGRSDYSEYGKQIVQTSDNCFIICGYTISENTGSLDVLISKIDSDGVLIWAKTIGTPNSEYPNSIILTDNDEIIVSGYILHSSSNRDIFVFKTESDGSLLWSRTSGNNQQNTSEKIKLLPNDEFILTGSFQDPISTNKFAFLAKFTANGDTIWTRTYNNSAVGEDVFCTNDGGYVIIGEKAEDLGHGYYYHPTMIKTDYYGNTGCSNNNNIEINTPSMVSDNIVLQFSNGGNIRYITNYNYESTQLSDSITCPIIANTPKLEGKTKSIIHPNPFTNTTTISFENPNNSISKIYIYNNVGQLIKQITNIKSNKVVFYRENLPPGIYYFHVFDKLENIHREKIIIQ